MESRPVWWALALSAASVVFLWATDIPLGIPGEWTWDRIRVPDDQRIELLLDLITVGIAAAAYIGFVWLGAVRLKFASRLETGGWLIGLAVAGFTWLWVVQESRPAEHRLSKAAWVLYYPGSSGYFYEARYNITDTRSFLRNYEQRLGEGDVLHFGTHPPGLFLMYRGLMRLSGQSAAFRWLGTHTQPDSVEQAFAIIDENSRAVGRLLLPVDRATIWLATLITQLFAALTVIPLFLLLRQQAGRQASWLSVAFWPLLPAIAIFLPKSDVLFPLVGITLVYAASAACRRRSALLAVVTGMILWLGMLLSLAVLPVALLAGWIVVRSCLVAAMRSESENDQRTSPLRVAGGLLAGFLIPILLFWLICDVNLLNVWLHNFRNHADFYSQYQRTYWKWLLVNALELATAVGLPIVVMMMYSLKASVRSVQFSKIADWPTSWGCAVIWILLWLSGKNMGEVARLWIIFMPWLIWMSLSSFERSHARSEERSINQRIPRSVFLLMVIQAIVCIATVIRVDGFHHQPPPAVSTADVGENGPK